MVKPSVKTSKQHKKNKNKKTVDTLIHSNERASKVVSPVGVVKVVGQAICDLRAIKATLHRTRKRGITPIFYPALHSTIDSNLKRLTELLSVYGKRIDVWVLQLNKTLPETQKLFFIGASEQAAWRQFQEWVSNNWDQCMFQAAKPDDPDERVNEFLEHAGMTPVCEQLPLPFVTSLPEPKKVDR